VLSIRLGYFTSLPGTLTSSTLSRGALAFSLPAFGSATGAGPAGTIGMKYDAPNSATHPNPVTAMTFNLVSFMLDILIVGSVAAGQRQPRPGA
jgi:hypothetical protein